MHRYCFNLYFLWSANPKTTTETKPREHIRALCFVDLFVIIIIMCLALSESILNFILFYCILLLFDNIIFVVILRFQKDRR